MDPSNNLSSTVNYGNQINTNIRPAMIDLTHATSSLVQTNGAASVVTPITPVSVPPAPPSTPTTPTFMSPPRNPIGTRGIPMAQLNETDEESE